MKNLVLSALLLVAAVYTNANAQHLDMAVSKKPGWHKIGQTTVSFKKETDEIMVIGNNKFTELKFAVKETPILLVSLELYFDKGATQKIVQNKEIAANGETETIKFDGGEHNLKKIKFVYKTLPNRKDEKAHVEVWGFKPEK